MRKSLLAILLLGGTSAVSFAKIDYATQIQPIFDNKCAQCHQPTRVVDGRRYKPRAGVVLTSTEGIAEAEVIDWGRPDHSLLVQRIMLDKADEDVMPPAKTQKPLTEQEKATDPHLDQGDRRLVIRIQRSRQADPESPVSHRSSPSCRASATTATTRMRNPKAV